MHKCFQTGRREFAHFVEVSDAAGGKRLISRAYARLTEIEEEEDTPAAEEMIARLVKGQEAVVRTARSVFPVVETASDEATADLLTQRMHVHEKNAWMLRSMLGNA